MSWLDRIKNDLVIKTGDGKEYKPQWVNAVKEKEYNIAEFEFINVSGALVKRSRPKARRYSLQIYFSGPDHLDFSEAFEKSADDPRFWLLTHPYYGLLSVQPTGLSFDNSKHNLTEIKATLIETLSDVYPKSIEVPKDQIAAAVETFNETVAENIEATITAKGIESSTVSKFQSFIERVNQYNAKVINSLSNTEEYYNALNSAQASIDNLTSTVSATPLETMKTAQKVICAPAEFTVGVRDRLATLVESFTDATTGTINSLSTLNLLDKFMYQANGGSLISGLCLAAATPQEEDYANMDAVLEIIDIILDNYNIFISTLNDTQTPDGGAPDSFIPDPVVLQQISQIVNYTIANLFNIALSARQQRSIILEYDSNWIILAHRFYGLDSEGKNIQALIKQNGAGLNEMLQVEKNRRIVYYT